MRTASGGEFLLHVEIANNNAADMPLRMLRYYTDIRFAGHQGPIRQFREYMTMLEILSESRDLRAQVEEAERMLTEIDIVGVRACNQIHGHCSKGSSRESAN